MLLDPRHLHILSAIVDAGGLSEGAMALGKSQPSLSRIVANLEARLGEPLFEKGRRPLRPTELCERLAAEGRTIARATHAAQSIADRFTSGQAGSVRVAGTPIFMDGVISNVIAGFQSAHPEVRVDQSYGYAKDLLDGITAGTIDIGICPMEEADVPSEFEFQPILKGRNVIACGAGHPLVRKRSLRLEDISEYPWITQPVGSPLFQDLRDVLNSIGVTDFKVSYSGGSLSSILNVLMGSNAMTVLPYSVVFMQPSKSIHALPIRIQHPRRQLGLLSKKDGTTQPAARRFVRHLTTQFRSLSQAITERQRQAVWKS
ncbi:LysR family transcriptional regulator [Roseobacter sp. YSTF-M11]|uniref:LysR family transcriptional regulator n=1 Tax=Roseobacter insulae TaxID=2859783 RepID=A0A9X1JXQ6_9RHOB|nr:LysR family transcriptional regulator [Roseobacter insulae]MBW4707251.1 LysR family transcriptional regulator [Roseobacter insulae]